MNVQQIMEGVQQMQNVQTQLEALLVHAKVDILEMVLLVMVLFFFLFFFFFSENFK